MQTLTLTAASQSVAPPRAPGALRRHGPTVARVLLGLVFFSFGLDAFLHYLPKPDLSSMPESALAFSKALIGTGYMLKLVKGTETLVGALLLSNRFVPLALTLLAPLLVNILLYHLFLAPAGLPMALVLLVLQLALVWQHRAAYRSLLSARS